MVASAWRKPAHAGSPGSGYGSGTGARSMYSLVLSIVASLTSAQTSRPASAAAAAIDRGHLSVRFRDNAESPKVLSGVAALFNLRDAPGFDALDEDSPGASAGLN